MRGRFDRRTLHLALLSALLLGALVEGAAWLVERTLVARGVVYRPPTVGDYDAYLRQRDPLLGWPLRAPDARRDASGSRIVPAAPDPSAPACLSLYGDSFTFGEDVAPEAAWGNLLAQRLGCRVANFGVGAYGSDQALLRFEVNRADRAPLILLGHMAENVARNVNQFRGFLFAESTVRLKPRFVLGNDGDLELIPLPDLSRAEYERMLHHPEAVLAHEGLLPGTRYGPVWGGLPHTLTLFRALASDRVAAYLRGGAYWNDLYRPDDPSRALALTAAILERFVDTAARQGRRGLVLVFPTRADLLRRRAGQPWPYAPLLAELRRRRIDVLDVGEPLLAAPPGVDLFVANGQHFNEEGNRRVAEAVEAFLRRRAAWPSDEGPR